MRLRVRYLYTFTTQTGAVAAALAQGASAVTNTAYDLRSERLGDSGRDAFADLETTRHTREGPLTVHLGRHSGLLVVVHDADVDAAELLAYEQEHTARIHHFVQQHVATSQRPVLQWVHRLLVADPADQDAIRDAVLPLAYFPAAALSRGGACIMGRGYSAVFTRHPDQVDAVELGLASAMQVHMLVDQASREAAALLTAVEDDRAAASSAPAQLRDRASAVIIRVRHIAEFTRRLRLSLLDARGVAFEATIEAWRVDEELAEVGDRVDACVRLVEAALDAHRSKQDARRNVLLYALAVLGVSQIVFAVYDFITADATIVGHSPRPVILAVTVVVIAGLMVFDVRRHRRSG